MISVCFWGKPFNITVIWVYAPTSNAEETEAEQFYENLQDLLYLTYNKGSISTLGMNMKDAAKDEEIRAAGEKPE